MEQEIERKDDYGDEAIKKRKRKQRLGMAAMIIVLVGISAACITVFVRTRKSDDTQMGQDFGGRGNSFSGDSIVTATGTTSIGIEAVTFDIDYLESTSLYVEEVYLESGDTATAGTKYLKFTQDSIDEARKELEATLLSAQLEYRSGVISDKESRISAKYNYDLALLESEQAQGVYDDTIASLQEQLDKAQAAYDDANEEYNELYNAIENNTFYEDYNIAELQKAYEDAYDLYINRMAHWDLTEDDLESSSSTMGSTSTASSVSISSSAQTSSDSSSAPSDGGDKPMAIDDAYSSSSNTPSTGDATDGGAPSQGGSGNGGGGAQADNSSSNEQKWIIKTCSLLKAEYEESKQEYEQAVEDYEEALDMAEINIQKLCLALETAREDLEDANLKYQKQSQSAKTQYETALVKGETAKLDYETQLTSLDEQLEKLADAKDEAQDNLDEFEATVGDGYLYTEEAGTILMVMTQADRTISGGEMLFAYSNPEKISVSVSVSQEYIAQIYVGEEATVVIDDYGTYSGTVQTINPVSASDSRSSVYYTVTVLLDSEDISDLSANLTATVVFGSVDMPTDMGDQQNQEMPAQMETQPEMGDQPNQNQPSDMGAQPDMNSGDKPGDMGGQHEEKENN